MSYKKTLIRSEPILKGLSLIEQADFWCFLNEMLFESGELVIVHENREIYFVSNRPYKKCRYRALAQAKRLVRKLAH